jgi:hypothetical protein
MKSFCITILITIFFFISIKETHAQTTQAKLNQIELMKQFIGNWKGELGKNTIYISDNKPFGTGMECNIQIISNGEINDSVKQLFGYDNKTDKYIIAELIKSSSVLEISSAWFTSEHTGKIFITDPDGDEIKFDFEFKTPDFLKQTAKLDNNIVLELTYNRIKK